MIGKLIKLALIIVLGILVYNFFLGDETEKANARQTFGKIKEVAVSVKDLVKSEKQKFDDGKYDGAVDKVGDLFKRIRDRAKDIDEKYVDQIANLEEKRQELEQRLEGLNKEAEAVPESYGDAEEGKRVKEKIAQEREKISEKLADLVEQSQRIMEDMEKEVAE